MEAARVDHNGSAFTVVAKEIRERANQSTKASDDINRMVIAISKGLKSSNELKIFYQKK